jgi:hypothetical protein
MCYGIGKCLKREEVGILEMFSYKQRMVIDQSRC